MAGSSSRPLRRVLDTNIVVAGLLWNGPPRRLIELAIEGEAVELYSSPVLLDELAHTLGYSKFDKRIESFATSIAALVAQYTALVGLVVPVSVPRIVAGDADDDHVIAAAVAARAELIVIGERKHPCPSAPMAALPSSLRARWSSASGQQARLDTEALATCARWTRLRAGAAGATRKSARSGCSSKTAARDGANCRARA